MSVGYVFTLIFFCVRIVWGSYQTYIVVTTFYENLTSNLPSIRPEPTFAQPYPPYKLSTPLASFVLISNIALHILNFYWLYTIISAVQRRDVKPKKAN